MPLDFSQLPIPNPMMPPSVLPSQWNPSVWPHANIGKETGYNYGERFGETGRLGSSSSTSQFDPLQLALLAQESGLMGQESGEEATRQSVIDRFLPIFQQYAQGMTPDIQGLEDTASKMSGALGERIDLGSPYYAAKQRDTAEQTSKQYNDAAAMTQQQIARQGQGAAPSGQAAAAIGELNTARAGSQSENFLRNLFQNENLQMNAINQLPQVGGLQQGAIQGKSAQTGMFNPASYFKQVPRMPYVGSPLHQASSQDASFGVDSAMNFGQQRGGHGNFWSGFNNGPAVIGGILGGLGF